ncbi:MgtC/SapB family protein [Proteinivorax hydrogeniformans]|uniref:MgtC/SapB family protein n=1 Tax=Proteinivorax hydrogeniformans TaxID=1826727 RepID=A0AAU8HNZ0_9FIRM
MAVLQLSGVLLLAIILGSVVGLEREINNHPAGFRTHALVCVGSALITIVSWKVYEMYQVGDPSRIAAQIVSGIGFLGAGTIMKEGSSIRGLTTAASLWAVAGTGMAVGFGYISIAITTTFLIVVVLMVFSKLEQKLLFTKQTIKVKIEVQDRPGILGEIASHIGSYNIDIRNVSLSSIDDKGMEIDLILSLTTKVSLQRLLGELAAVSGVDKVNYDG